MQTKTIILMGIKHCGKSTQGKILAKKFDSPFFDTDDTITALTGKTARQIYAEEGEEAFKLAEKNACRHIAEQLNAIAKPGVIATGGGICNNVDAILELKQIGTFVFLNSQEKTAADRIIKEAALNEDGKPVNIPAYIAKKNPRSIQEVRTFFHEFFEERVRMYKGIADVAVTMKRCGKEENSKQIIAALRSKGIIA